MPHTLAASAGTPTGGPHCCIMTEPDQFDLFAEGTPPSPAKPRRARRDGVAAARVDAEVTTLAAQLPPGVRLGTSSWAFPGWAGLVYDGDYAEAKLAREGLAAYAAHPFLRSVGIYPPGSHVRLASGALAIVVGRGPTITAPLVARLTEPDGRSLPAPRRQATSEPGQAVVALQSPRRGGLQLPSELLVTLD